MSVFTNIYGTPIYIGSDLVAIPDKYHHPSLARSEFVLIQFFFSPFLAQTQVECQFSQISTVHRYIGPDLVAILDKYYHPSSAQIFQSFFQLRFQYIVSFHISLLPIYHRW